ncbi:glycosyltransferase family 4 protein [Bacillus sp. AFS055030]|uniref:glycosyltransferase family 4 protein n=1 Tax=Bacillus sp. AFS055030 TaxID=2033507 RepID=UPI000BFB8CB5|nr:glycosyltransferase family 4 protein [Bacillus sp. AFS055030]PGL70167.1 hypothetical protein CN925_13345 [Bacillus sp. AFS055030]
MNVLMITPDYPPSVGGIGSHVKELTSNLIEQGCKVTVLVIRLDRSTLNPDELKVNSSENLTVVTFPSEFKVNFPDIEDFDYNKYRSEIHPFKFAAMSLEIFPMVFNYLKTCKKFDILHVHDAYNAYISVIVKRLFNIPMVTTLHALSTTVFNIVDSNRRYILNNSNSIIAVSSWMKEQLEPRFGKISTSVQVIHNGVSSNFSNKMLPKEKGNFQKRKIITFCGRLIPIKGCHILISAFAKVLAMIDSGTDLKLKIIGDGNAKEELEYLVKRLNLEPFVEFTGYKSPSEVREILNTSSVHVVPSLTDNFPMVALEAMAEGTPLIVSAVGGLVEIVKDGQNGILVSPNNIEELARAIILLLNNKQTAMNYSKKGLEVVKGINWASTATKTLEVYNQTLIEYENRIHHENHQRQMLTNDKKSF